MSWLAPAYAWIKAFHIVAVIAWMAGLLYLPRLFVYHSAAEHGSPQAETFIVMERRLLRGIMNPAMIAVYVLGILLSLTPGIVDWGQSWIHAKLALVIGLTVYHHLLARWRKDLAAGRNRRPARFYRIVNEVPTVVLIAIVVLVVVKPF
jgi:putative membrane protein